MTHPPDGKSRAIESPALASQMHHHVLRACNQRQVSRHRGMALHGTQSCSRQRPQDGGHRKNADGVHIQAPRASPPSLINEMNFTPSRASAMVLPNSGRPRTSGGREPVEPARLPAALCAAHSNHAVPASSSAALRSHASIICRLTTKVRNTRMSHPSCGKQGRPAYTDAGAEHRHIVPHKTRAHASRQTLPPRGCQQRCGSL